MSTITNYKTHIFSGPTQSIVGAVTGSTDYLDINWIGSTGIQYIDTGITPTTSYNIEVVGIKDNNASLFGAGACSYVLTGNGSGTDKYPNYFYVGQTLTSPSESGQIVGTIDQAAKHTWSIISGQGYCDGVAASPTRIGSTQPTNSLFLFARNTGSFNDGGKHTIYSVKIWDNNGTLVRNFVPKIQLSTGKPGLYDTVNSVFYSNNGTGEFTYELENCKGRLLTKATLLPSTYTEVAYLESTGTQYIDTGINFDSQAITGTLDFQYTGLSGGNNEGWIVGAGGLIPSPGVHGMEGGIFSNVFYTGNGVSYSQTADIYARTTAYMDCSSQDVQNKNIYLFSRNWSETAKALPAKAKIYSCTFSNGGTLTRNFVPCYRNSDNKPGMYDTVNDVFYTNQGTNEFILGPEINLANYKCLIYEGA